jgi:hypothetical protein
MALVLTVDGVGFRLVHPTAHTQRDVSKVTVFFPQGRTIPHHQGIFVIKVHWARLLDLGIIMNWHSHRKDDGILNVPPNDVLIGRPESERTGKLEAFTKRRGMGETHMTEHPFNSDGLGPLAHYRVEFARLRNGPREHQGVADLILTVPPDIHARCLSLRWDAVALHDVGKGLIALVLGLLVFSGDPAHQDSSREQKLRVVGSKVYRIFFRARRIGRERGL